MTMRRFALILSAAAMVCASALTATPASAQGYPAERYVDRGYGVHIPPRQRARPVDPYYGNRPSMDRRYGRGWKRHWRRWTGDSHPGYRRPPQGWARPRAYEYRY